MANDRKAKPKNTYEPRIKRVPKPLDSSQLQELALAYVARFSTSTAKLEAYLKRKLRERGWVGNGAADGAYEGGGEYAEEEMPDISAICARYVELGYIDDELYAKSKAGGLLRRGYGARRVSQALYADGISEDIRENLAPNEYAGREAAQIMARKRRFGPYFAGELEENRRGKQIAAMLRAGHGFDSVLSVIDASTVAAVDQWVEEARDEFEEGDE